MKYDAIQERLYKSSKFLDVACIALDNVNFFVDGNAVSFLLEEVNEMIDSCLKDLERLVEYE